jgi:hypothetical protein
MGTCLFMHRGSYYNYPHYGAVGNFFFSILQLFTRERPYPTLSDAAVIARVVSGGYPPRPTLEQCHGYAFPDSLWTVLKKCWKSGAAKRPPIQFILNTLEELSIKQLCDRARVSREAPIYA